MTSTFFLKSLAVFIIGLGFKLFLSCETPPSYSNEPIEINFNQLKVIGVDNSMKKSEMGNHVDTMYKRAVALRVNITDTVMYYATFQTKNSYRLFAFSTASADDISPYYVPQNKVVDITIKTLFDINPTIKAGDNVTEHMLSPRDFNLYHNLEKVIPYLNGDHYYKERSILVVLKESVENTNAQFEVTVSLENGHQLSCTTERITIIEP